MNYQNSVKTAFTILVSLGVVACSSGSSSTGTKLVKKEMPQDTTVQIIQKVESSTEQKQQDVKSEQPKIEKKEEVKPEQPKIDEKGDVKSEQPKIDEKGDVKSEQPKIEEKGDVKSEQPKIEEKGDIKSEQPKIEEKGDIKSEQPKIEENPSVQSKTESTVPKTEEQEPAQSESSEIAKQHSAQPEQKSEMKSDEPKFIGGSSILDSKQPDDNEITKFITFGHDGKINIKDKHHRGNSIYILSADDGRPVMEILDTGEFDYQIFGRYMPEEYVKDFKKLSLISIGSKTERSAIPTQGKAHYSGTAISYRPTEGYSLDYRSVIDADVDFDQKQLQISSDFGEQFKHLNFKSTAYIDAQTNVFKGNIEKLNSAQLLGLSGELNGAFYGPNAEEMGGTFKVNVEDVGAQFLGAFGTKKKE